MTEKFKTKQEAVKAILQLLKDNKEDFTLLYEEVGMAYDQPDGGGLMAKTVFTKGDDIKIEGVASKEFTLDSLTRLYKEIGIESMQKKHGDFKRRYLVMRSNLNEELVSMANNETFKFSGSECPRMYFDNDWREICYVQVPASPKFAVRVGWHDDRCSGKGTNAFANLSNCPMETEVELFEIICRKICK